MHKHSVFQILFLYMVSVLYYFQKVSFCPLDKETLKLVKTCIISVQDSLRCDGMFCTPWQQAEKLAWIHPGPVAPEAVVFLAWMGSDLTCCYCHVTIACCNQPLLNCFLLWLSPVWASAAVTFRSVPVFRQCRMELHRNSPTLFAP